MIWCWYCADLLAEMKCSMAEVRAIQQELVAQGQVNCDWLRWQRLAADRCVSAMADFYNHLITHRVECFPAPVPQPPASPRDAA